MKYIRDFLNWVQKKEEKTAGQDITAEESAARLDSLTYYYLEQWIQSLPREATYMLCEELPSSSVITHLMSVSWVELAEYVRKVYIPSHPPKFIIVEL